jgi:hypothetical protein
LSSSGGAGPRGAPLHPAGEAQQRAAAVRHGTARAVKADDVDGLLVLDLQLLTRRPSRLGVFCYVCQCMLLLSSSLVCLCCDARAQVCCVCVFPSPAVHAAPIHACVRHMRAITMRLSGAHARAPLPRPMTRTSSGATATPRSGSARYHKRGAAAPASEDGSSREHYYDY